ncbi:MAG: carbohydrate ABC transporter permease [Caldilineaceae bacterium]|nr:carbohydrate ABC transporter permease [Caldilineaceae bacterium]MBP8106366.1 carbohydrate ABC transporter permease [Caldilineaceae bacterium]MBP8121451.1 carbohydrate ABC transporter permease [Caldilineaceae bacterium]MBP9073706.1 carbohydrate ABC transporter permease [Caldilineaceae bacterium]
MKIILTKKTDSLIMGAFLLIFAALWLVPVYSAVNRSLVFNGWQNYVSLFSDPIGGVTIYRTYLNSAVNALGHASFVLTISALSGFAFSKLSFSGKNLIYYMVIICLAVPGTAIIVPLFHTLKTFGFLNTYWAVILPETALTLPFGVLLMRNYYDGLPNEYLEASTIDGATMFQVFYKIYLPLSRSALINLGVLAVMWSFQDFLLPLMFLTKSSMSTAAVAVQSFKEYLSFTPDNIGKYNASLVLLAVPALLLLIFGQRFITQGLTSGGIKE